MHPGADGSSREQPHVIDDLCHGSHLANDILQIVFQPPGFRWAVAYQALRGEQDAVEGLIELVGDPRR